MRHNDRYAASTRGTVGHLPGLTHPRRWFVRLLLPYRTRAANALHLAIFLLAIIVGLLNTYIVYHNAPGWPWEDHGLRYATRTLPLHWSDASDNGLNVVEGMTTALTLGPFALWAVAELVWKLRGRVGLLWRYLYPYLYLTGVCAVLIGTLYMDDTLRLSGSGLWYRWGLIRWTTIRAYQWQPATALLATGPPVNGRTLYRERPTGNYILTVRLAPAFPYAATMAWGIPSWDTAQVDGALRHYLPGRGTRLPRSPRSSE